MHLLSQNMDGALVGKSAHIEVHSRGVELVEEDVEEEGEEEGSPAGGQHAAHLPRGEWVGVAVDIHQHHVLPDADSTRHCQPGQQGNELLCNVQNIYFTEARTLGSLL